MQAGHRGDAADGAGVDDEVLPEALARLQAEALGQGPDLRRPEQVGLTERTGAPFPSGARAAGAVSAAAGRYRLHGPKTRSPVAEMIAHSLATSSCLAAARALMVCAT